MRRALLITLALVAMPLTGCLGDDAPGSPTNTTDNLLDGNETNYEPHVVVGVPDSGINPYHELYHRPNLTQHPSTYIEDFPEDIEKLPLSVGMEDYQEAYEQDKELWDNVEPGQWYWIPQTVFVAVSCEEGTSGNNTCILDDNGMHGTGTTSSIIMENPDARIAFKEGGSGIGAFLSKLIPVDIFSVSWGYIAPIPAPGPAHEAVFGEQYAPLYVKAAGNDPRSTLTTAWSGDPAVISVDGAYAEDDTEEAAATKQPDIVSYYCRPTAQTQAVSEIRESYCGTSFAAPTAAGALSKVVLEIRQDSGYTGNLVNDTVDPIHDVTVSDVRYAMNQTASYEPEGRYDNTQTTGVPVNPAAPWTQWGWGFYDGLVANHTTEYMLGDNAGEQLKSDQAQAYMEGVYEARKSLYG